MKKILDFTSRIMKLTPTKEKLKKIWKKKDISTRLRATKRV
jgi:cytochrome oxidase Cu insertion factor (SCO1/SenC/PrrC family)